MTAEIESHTFFGAVRPYRVRVAFTYGVMFLENILELLYPFAIGLAINDLIAGKGALSLAPFAGIWFFQLIAATARQLYDTRLFARIYGEVSGRMIVRQREAGVSTGEVAARSVMAREAVDFFEFELPTLVTALVSMLGGMAMLFFYDLTAGAIMASLLAPILIIYFFYGRRTLALSRRLNNRHEREVGAIEDGRRPRVIKHFRALARWRVMLSDLQAGTWAASDLLVFGAVMVVVLRIASEPGVQAGDVYAAISYVLTVALAFDQAPIIVEQLSRLVDIRRRVDKSSE